MLRHQWDLASLLVVLGNTGNLVYGNVSSAGGKVLPQCGNIGVDLLPEIAGVNPD